ncbi:MAG: PhzF family phenazine biosynthesis protein [Candidatus Acidiferrum sp.]
MTLDVFSRRPLEGNQLAVFGDARGLSDAEMQALARETNYAETTFILPRDVATERERGVRVRIFTVAEELPFAGHPTLGTAFYLHTLSQAGQVRLELNVGTIPVGFSQREGATFGEMTQRDPEFGSVHEREAVAQAVGLSLEDVDAQFPIQTVSTGLPQAIVPVRTLAALRGINFQWKRADEYLRRTDAKFFYFVTRETEDPKARLHARMLFYNGEDPATGSAGGNTAAWMVQHGVAHPEEQVMIEQGLEMKRPSQIFVRAGKQNGTVGNVRVGGHVVQVMRGELAL